MKLLTIIIIVLAISFNFSQHKEHQAFIITGFAQGTTYTITYYATDSLIKQQQIDSIFERLDSSLSIYKPYSLISKFNASSSDFIKVDKHLYNVVQFSVEASLATERAFDITVGPLVEAWGFHKKQSQRVPDSTEIDSLLACTGLENLILAGGGSTSNYYLKKLKPCLQIDINGIAQGYSVDVIADFLETRNIQNYLVELGGEIRVKGRKPGNKKMEIGIETPGNDPFGPNSIKTIISVDSGAITTSGSYRNRFEQNGIQYTHIIDPKTGYPIQNELLSVSVYSTSAMGSDACDNALMVMGLEKAMKFAIKYSMSVYFIYKTGKGEIKDTATAGFYQLMVR